MGVHKNANVSKRVGSCAKKDELRKYCKYDQKAVIDALTRLIAEITR